MTAQLANQVLAKHTECGCVTKHQPTARDKPWRSIKHQACSLDIEGFMLAIDCDECRVFTGTTAKRPDLLVLREKNNTSEWLVIEIKNQTGLHARSQIKAGAEAISFHVLFKGLAGDMTTGLLAFKKSNRTSDLNRLRKPMRVRGRQVTVQVRRCGKRV